MSKYNADPIINFDAIQRVQKELSKLFEGDWIVPSERNHAHTEQAAQKTHDTSAQSQAYWEPTTDVLQNEQSYQYIVELPGVALADIDVSVHRGLLSITGNKSNPLAESYTSVESEANYGRFEKHIHLPEDVNEASLAATMNSGLLTLSIKRLEASRARKIPVSEVC